MAPNRGILIILVPCCYFSSHAVSHSVIWFLDHVFVLQKSQECVQATTPGIVLGVRIAVSMIVTVRMI